jgi:hypothetical protein
MENGDFIEPVERPPQEKTLPQKKNEFFWVLFNWKGNPIYKVIPKKAPIYNRDIRSMLSSTQMKKMYNSWNESEVKDRRNAIGGIRKMLKGNKLDSVLTPSTGKKKTELYTYGWKGERKYHIVYTGYSKRTPGDIKDVLDRSTIYAVSTKGERYSETRLDTDEKFKAVKKIATMLDRHRDNPEFVAQLTSPRAKTEDIVPRRISFPIAKPVFSHAMLSVRGKNRERMFVVEWAGNRPPPAALTESNARNFLKYARVYKAPKGEIATISAYKSQQGQKKWNIVATSKMLAMIKSSNTSQFVVIERPKKRRKKNNV